MTIVGYIIPETGPVEPIDIDPNGPFDSLEYARAIIGADLDVCTAHPAGPVPQAALGHVISIMVDEWGYRKPNLGINRRATVHYSLRPLVGTAIIIMDTPEGESWPEMPPAARAIIEEGERAEWAAELDAWLSLHPDWRGGLTI